MAIVARIIYHYALLFFHQLSSFNVTPPMSYFFLPCTYIHGVLNTLKFANFRPEITI